MLLLPIVAAASTGFTMNLTSHRATSQRALQDAEPDQTNAPEGCKIVEVGCFADGDNCDGDVSDCRSLQYGVDCCSGPGTSPAPTPSPQCDQPTLTNEACVLYCYDWLKDLSPDVVYGGTNNGECYCDTEYNPGEQNGLCGGACPESSTGCTLPCNGNPAEMCGSAWFNMVYKVDCGGGGQWPFAFPLIVGFFSLTGLYLVGGVYVNNSAGKTGRDLIPNRAAWEQLFGLVGDGLAFTMGHGKPAPAIAGYDPVVGSGAPPAGGSYTPGMPLPPQQGYHGGVLPHQTYPSGHAGAGMAVDGMYLAPPPQPRRKKKPKPGSGGSSPAEGRRRKKKPAVGTVLAIEDTGDSSGGASKKKKKKKRPAEPPAAGME